MTADPQTPHPSRSAGTHGAEAPTLPRWAVPAVLVAMVALLAGLAVPIAAHPQPASQDLAGVTAESSADGPQVPEIVFPVVGPVWFTDTWGACRGAGCSRGHEGVDIFGHKLAPVVAAADGVITADRRSGLGLGGNLVAITADDGWRYLYIHLNNDAPGTDDGSNPQAWIVPNRLRVGDRVAAGDVIGYVGDSGNAETTPSHLHFEAHAPGVGAVNPTAAAEAAQEAGRVVSVASLASTPEGRAEAAPIVTDWYRTLLGREPTEMELFAWTDRFDIGFADADDLIADLTMARPRRDLAGDVLRAFEVSLDRRPTLNEIQQWEIAVRNGTDLESMTATLIDSGPFRDRHGDLTDEAFIRAIYRNAIGVDPTDERLADWLALLAEGSPRSALTAYWADSYSVKNSTWHGLEVIQAYRAALDRMPDDAEYGRWVAHLDAGGLIPDVVAALRDGTAADDGGQAGDDGTDPEAPADATDPADGDDPTDPDPVDGEGDPADGDSTDPEPADGDGDPADGDSTDPEPADGDGDPADGEPDPDATDPASATDPGDGGDPTDPAATDPAGGDPQPGDGDPDPAAGEDQAADPAQPADPDQAGGEPTGGGGSG